MAGTTAGTSTGSGAGRKAAERTLRDGDPGSVLRAVAVRLRRMNGVISRLAHGLAGDTARARAVRRSRNFPVPEGVVGETCGTCVQGKDTG